MRVNGAVDYQYCPTEEMLADMLTKALGNIELKSMAERSVLISLFISIRLYIVEEGCWSTTFTIYTFIKTITTEGRVTEKYWPEPFIPLFPPFQRTSKCGRKVKSS